MSQKGKFLAKSFFLNIVLFKFTAISSLDSLKAGVGVFEIYDSNQLFRHENVG
jgi:hypothetical protein